MKDLLLFYEVLKDFRGICALGRLGPQEGPEPRGCPRLEGLSS